MNTANNAPVITVSVEILNVTVGEAASFTAEATDNDVGDTASLFYSLTLSNNDSVDFSSQVSVNNAQYSWTPKQADSVTLT